MHFGWAKKFNQGSSREQRQRWAEKALLQPPACAGASNAKARRVAGNWHCLLLALMSVSKAFFMRGEVSGR